MIRVENVHMESDWLSEPINVILSICIVCVRVLQRINIYAVFRWPEIQYVYGIYMVELQL